MADLIYVHREAHVVFCQCFSRGPGTRDVVELGQLATFVERIVRSGSMQHRSHPPGEPLDFPDSAKTNFRVSIQKIHPAMGVKFAESLGKYPDISDGEVQTFGTSRWNDVGRIPSQEQSAVLHGLRYETSHSRYTFLEDGPFG